MDRNTHCMVYTVLLLATISTIHCLKKQTKTTTTKNNNNNKKKTTCEFLQLLNGYLNYVRVSLSYRKGIDNVEALHVSGYGN